MSDHSPWNPQVIEEARTTREYNNCFRRLQECQTRAGTTTGDRDIAFAERWKDQAFANMMSAIAKRK